MKKQLFEITIKCERIVQFYGTKNEAEVIGDQLNVNEYLTFTVDKVDSSQADLAVIDKSGHIKVLPIERKNL